MDWLIRYAYSFIGKPYVFGGDDPISGFDCSGFVSELLRAAGVVPPHYRDTAQGIYNLLDKTGSFNALLPGALAFYGENALKITHVGFCLDSRFMIEAGGGDSSTTTPAVQIQKNSFVRLRPIRYRQDFLFTLRPTYLF